MFSISLDPYVITKCTLVLIWPPDKLPQSIIRPVAGLGHSFRTQVCAI